MGSTYREIQILVALSNQCFQDYIWPVFEFLGAVGSIIFLYSLVVVQDQLPFYAIGLVFMFFVAITCICCYMMEMCSSFIQISVMVLNNAKKLKRDKWSRVFFQSCPPIALKVASFHKIDKQRVSSWIKFILQRTFFLVLKTRLSINAGANIIVELPFS